MASRVDDLEGVLLPLVLERLGEGVLNGGVVRVYKMVLHKLHGQRGLACVLRIRYTPEAAER